MTYSVSVFAWRYLEQLFKFPTEIAGAFKSGILRNKSNAAFGCDKKPCRLLEPAVYQVMDRRNMQIAPK